MGRGGTDKGTTTGPAVEQQPSAAVVGSLGWLAHQTHRDIALCASDAQRSQAKPTYADLHQTDKAVKKARDQADSCLTFLPLNLNDIVGRRKWA
jgi:hypothetical protein